MEIIRVIIDACTTILNITIDLFGYNISLFQVLAYGILVGLVILIFNGLFR